MKFHALRFEILVRFSQRDLMRRIMRRPRRFCSPRRRSTASGRLERPPRRRPRRRRARGGSRRFRSFRNTATSSTTTTRAWTRSRSPGGGGPGGRRARRGTVRRARNRGWRREGAPRPCASSRAPRAKTATPEGTESDPPGTPTTEGEVMGRSRDAREGGRVVGRSFGWVCSPRIARGFEKSISRSRRRRRA